MAISRYIPPSALARRRPVAALRDDPARFKSAFVGAGGVDPGYAARAMTFNKALYEPSDTRPQTAQMPTFLPTRAETSYANRGRALQTWQQPLARAGVTAIASRYRSTPTGLPEPLPAYTEGGAANPFKTVSTNPDVQPLNPNIPTLAGEPEPTGSGLASADPLDNPNLGPGGMNEIVAPAAPTLLTGNSRPTNLTHPPVDDTTHARGVIDEFQSILDGVNGGADVPPSTTPTTYPTSSVESRPPGAWNTPFIKTGTADWGTGLDQRPQSSGPAQSSQRFYQRALDRAQQGSKSDINRINRLDRRINGR